LAKKAKYTTVRDKADKAQSRYIRVKAMNEEGLAMCWGCNGWFPLEKLQAGHFIPKSAGANVRYIEENVHPECVHCNMFSNGEHMIGYTLNMLDYYGQDMIDHLKRESRKTLSASERYRQAEEAFEYYENALKELL
jgi:hypothetical protein